MTPTPDAFLALARSSPWRWTTLHFTHRSGPAGETEAWLRRPGQLLVRDGGGEEHLVVDPPTTRTTRVSFAGSTMPERYRDGPALAPHERPTPVLPRDVTVPLRPDGLVAQRPGHAAIEYDDPMWQGYSWVAMLDPVELSHHVGIDRLRAEQVHGRPVWRADLTAQPGYEPRCGGNCCELLWSEVGLLADFDDLSGVPQRWRGRVYPEAYDVALDVETGVVVRCHAVGDHPGAPWLEVDIHAVDVDLDHVFTTP